MSEIAELKAAHRHAKTQREADRIKAVVLLGKGWKAAAETLLLGGHDAELLGPIPGGRA